MKFDHKVTIDAPKQTVREYLDDFKRAAFCLPGLEEITEAEPDVFDGRVKVKIGPFGMNVAGRAKVERGDENTFRVNGEGRDRRVGTSVTAAVEAQLAELSPTQTEMHLLADVQFTGRLAELGQPLIKKKADSYVQEFAQNLRKAISNS